MTISTLASISLLMSPSIADRLALLASLLASACGCARGCCSRCSMRAVDRAAGRQPGHLAAILAGSQSDLTCGVAASYARALGVSPAWLAYGLGACVDASARDDASADAYLRLLTLDPARETDHEALAAHLLASVDHAALRADAPAPAPVATPRRRAGRTMTPRRAPRKPRTRRHLRESEGAAVRA